MMAGLTRSGSALTAVRTHREHSSTPVARIGSAATTSVRNSLIALEPAAAYAVFDADDVMHPHYLRTLLRWVGTDGIAGGSRRQIDTHGKPMSNERSPFRSGVAVFSHDAWARLGGYRAWKIAADHDLIVRAKALGITVTGARDVLYSRRVHGDSLTRRPDTGFGSQMRREYKALAHHLARLRCNLYVAPTTTPMEYREA
jgi:hypothetical protein